MIRAFIITLTLAISLSCLAESGTNSQGFIRKLGGYPLSDTSTNRLTIVAAKGTDGKLSVTLTWNASDSVTKPLRDGWFIYPARTMHRFWVFDGDTLSLLSHTASGISDESNPEVDKTCPKEVRDALPESIRKKYFQ
jgi:hypothetical protein